MKSETKERKSVDKDFGKYTVLKKKKDQKKKC
jgi:hypothetical protein